MPASCPFCGATLNLGLKFCVVCGRHTTNAESSKLSGLKGGVRQGDATRRLDEVISALDFEKTRKKPSHLNRHIRLVGEQIFYALIGMTLLFCAVRFTLSTYFPGKVHKILEPILGRNSGVIEQGLTGLPPADEDEETEAKPLENKQETKPASAKSVAQGKKSKVRSKQKSRRRWRRHRHRHVQRSN